MANCTEEADSSEGSTSGRVGPLFRFRWQPDITFILQIQITEIEPSEGRSELVKDFYFFVFFKRPSCKRKEEVHIFLVTIS